MPVRPDKHEYFLKMLELVASRGTCPRRRVAAIITDQEGHILSTGYNGVPAGIEHCTDLPCPGAADPSGDSGRCWAVHAELNALLQCTRPEAAYRMYVTCTPCFTCAKAICNTMIGDIYCKTEYTDQRGIELFAAKGIRVYVGTNRVV